MGLESRHKEEEADTESHYCRIRKQFGLEELTHSMLRTHPGSAALPWKHALQTSSHMLRPQLDGSAPRDILRISIDRLIFTTSYTKFSLLAEM